MRAQPVPETSVRLGGRVPASAASRTPGIGTLWDVLLSSVMRQAPIAVAGLQLRPNLLRIGRIRAPGGRWPGRGGRGGGSAAGVSDGGRRGARQVRAVCRPGCLEPGGMDAQILGGVQGAALEALAAEIRRIEARRRPGVWTTRATVRGSIACQPTAWAGTQSGGAPLGRGGTQIRRNTSRPGVDGRGLAPAGRAPTGHDALTPEGMPTCTALPHAVSLGEPAA